MNTGNVLLEKKMADGRTLRVLRYVSPEDEVPERVVRYVIGSLGFDSYNKYIQVQAYWRSWYRESFEGKLGFRLTYGGEAGRLERTRRLFARRLRRLPAGRAGDRAAAGRPGRNDAPLRPRQDLRSQ